MILTELMTTLSKRCKTDQKALLFFEDGLIFKSNKNTGIFESTNCLQLEDPDYMEFYDCAFEISEIVHLPPKADLTKLKNGIYFAISEYDEPQKIEDIGGGAIIWQSPEPSPSNSSAGIDQGGLL